MKMRKLLLPFALLALMLALSGCAPGRNPHIDMPNQIGYIAGFWRGLWHGWISPITFICSWFTDSVSVYEIHNSGFLYNLGFLFGIGAFAGGASSTARD